MYKNMIREKLTSGHLYIRIITLTILFFLVFFGVTIASYYFLPEGFLSNKNNLTDFDASTNFILLAFQIFTWNMLSVAAILVSSLFSKKKREEQNYLSLSYFVFMVLVSLSAVTLGTWSFTVHAEPVPLLERIISMFRVTERAGLVELYGQLLITCSVSNRFLVMTCQNKTITRTVRDITWGKSELICFVTGILLMFMGAFIESNAILGLCS